MGKKIALCVGLDKYGPETTVTPLRGCVNDAVLIGQMLRLAGFDVRQVHNEAATQKGILTRLERDVARLREGDYFVFWNSSHGYQVCDRSGDELHDGLDEAICPYDTDPRDPLMDDKLAKVFSRANLGARVFIASDSCHSGSVTRECYTSMNDPQTPPTQAQPRLWLPPDDVRFRAGRVEFDLATYFDDPKEVVRPAATAIRWFGRLGHPPPEVSHVVLSGCRADQVSWDAPFNSRHHGAMTYHFAKIVVTEWKAGRAISYREAHARSAAALQEAGFDQDPELIGAAHLLDETVFGHVP